MTTESGLEEFVLWVSARHVMTVMRQFDGCEWSHRDWANPPHDVTIVKAYAPGAWQGFPYVQGDRHDVQIGYCERRLTDEERERVIEYVFRYWDIPF